MKALVVDSSRVVIHMLSGVFGKVGIETLAAGSGVEALSFLKQEQVDLLCFSYELGDMNGIDLFVAARAAKLLRLQPALMFASTHSKDVVTRALEIGVTECFSKHKMKHFEQFVENFAAGTRIKINGSVLLVEDSVAMALYYRNVLENMGLRVEHCLSAEDAIEKISLSHYDLVVSDYVLAGTETGLSVIRFVRSSPGKKAQTPVLVISAFDEVARKVEVMRNGANDFIAKPVVAEELEVRVSNLITMQKLVRRLEYQHEAMRDMAMRDPLTSLYNRYYLDEISPGLIGEVLEGGLPLILMVIDIDHFKRINDTHGHKSGDMVLEQLAKALQGFCRNDDMVARVGGEEFVAILPSVGMAEAIVRAEALRVLIANLMPLGIPVTVSIGLSLLRMGESYDDLFRRADAAVYRAKAAGRNRIEVSATALGAPSTDGIDGLHAQGNKA